MQHCYRGIRIFVKRYPEDEKDLKSLTHFLTFTFFVDV